MANVSEQPQANARPPNQLSEIELLDRIAAGILEQLVEQGDVALDQTKTQNTHISKGHEYKPHQPAT